MMRKCMPQAPRASVQGALLQEYYWSILIEHVQHCSFAGGSIKVILLG